MLRPYATNPRPSTASMLHKTVIFSPIQKPITRDPIPEKVPFNKTICIGSFDEIFLVQLFSSPHKTLASKINSDPVENLKLEKSSKVSRQQETVINKIPDQSLALIFSLKRNN